MQSSRKPVAKMGRTSFQAQYQQEPAAEDGVIIRRNWLRYYEELPDQFDFVLVSWDTASTLSEDSDWSVGTVWGLVNGEVLLLHVERMREEVPELRRRIEQLHVDRRADLTLIEDADLGRGIAQDLRRMSRTCKPLLVRPRIEKVARMQARSVMFETGRVILPARAPWLGAYLDELIGFPNQKHDDQVDSTSQALDWIQLRFASDLRGEATPPSRPAGRKRPQGSSLRRSADLRS